MPNYDELFKQYCLKQNSEETVSGVCAMFILGFIDFLKEKAVEHSYAADGGYCPHCEVNGIYDGCCINCGVPAAIR